MEIVRQILATRAHVLAGLIAFWAVCGLVLGVIAAIVAYRVLCRVGAFELHWRFAAWPRRLVALWLIVAFAVLGGMIGGCEGTPRGVRRIVQESQFRTEVLQPAGNAVALGLFRLNATVQSPDEADSLAESFERGEIEFDVVEFSKTIEVLESHVVREVVTHLGDDLRRRSGYVVGGIVDMLVGESLEFVVRRHAIVLAKGHLEHLKRFHLDRVVQEFFATLLDAAHANGDSDGIAYKELADHIVEHGLAPMILKPVKTTARSQQTTLVVLMLVSGVVPVAGFWLARRTTQAPEPPEESRSDEAKHVDDPKS